MFRALGQAVKVFLVALWWAALFVLEFCGPYKNGHEFSLVDDGDEFCVRHCFGGLIFATSSSLRPEFLLISGHEATASW